LALDNYVISTPTPSATRGGVTPAAAANIFTAATASGYPSNATLITSTLLDPNAPISTALASNLLAGSAWIVAFDVPTGGGSQAWGIPYIDLVNGVSTISGVRIMNAGAGYPATAAAIPMTLMPNPFRNTGATPTIAAPAIALGAFGPANATNFFTAAFAVQANVNLTSALSNSGTIGFELPGVGAYLTFTVTNAGSGYSQAPTAVVSDGGLTFQAIANALNPGAGVAAGANTVGVTMTGSAVTASGASVVRVGTTFTGGAANQGRFTFALGSDPGFLSNPSVFIIDQLSNALTNAYNAAVNTPGNPYITIGANGAIIGLGSELTANNQTALQLSKLPNAFVNTWPAVSYHSTPIVTIAAPGTGTTATAVIDPAGVETATFVPGIRPDGSNGTIGVPAVTAVNGWVDVTFTNTNAADQLVNITVGSTTSAAVQSANAGSAAVAAAVGVGVGATRAVTVPGTTATGGPTGSAVIRFSTGGTAAPTGVAVSGTLVAGVTAVVGTSTAGVAGVAGTAATNGTPAGKIQAIRVVNGGSGYGRGNLYQRWFTTLGAGQNYTIIGNEQIGNANGGGIGGINHANAVGSAFDVATGVTYIRDIHYGTGKRVD